MSLPGRLLRSFSAFAPLRTRRAPALALLGFTLGAAFAHAGCSSSPRTKGEGEPCPAYQENATCAPGLECAFHVPSGAFCARACSTTADCTGGRVCATYSGQSYCVQPCEGHYSPGGACVDGVPTECRAITDGSSCAECKQCGETERCDTASDRCVPREKVGGPCASGGDCLSNNCGVPASVDSVADAGADADAAPAARCLVPAGAPCTNRNCASCEPGADGGTACAQGCTQDEDCPILDYDGSCHADHKRYYVCLGGGPSQYFCRKPCAGFDDCPNGTTCSTYMTNGSCSDYMFDQACVP